MSHLQPQRRCQAMPAARINPGIHHPTSTCHLPLHLSYQQTQPAASELSLESPCSARDPLAPQPLCSPIQQGFGELSRVFFDSQELETAFQQPPQSPEWFGLKTTSEFISFQLLALGRDMLHWTCLLHAPSSLVLNTSKNPAISWGMRLVAEMSQTTTR